MHFSESTLDDLLMRVLESLLSTGSPVTASRGSMIEQTGVLLELSNPRARLSHTERKGKIFSCLGEFIWYMAKTDELDFISYYIPQYENDSEDGQTLYGAYGPRLFSMRSHDQIANIVAILTKTPSSRRAVIQLFNAEDIANEHKEVPCTSSLQFMIRNSQLHLMTCMRSNDAFIGLPHDVFAFTMLQELVARTLGVEVGHYKHFVGSLHLYDTHIHAARQYIDEGFQPTIDVAMPVMPDGDQRSALTRLVETESRIRLTGSPNVENTELPAYWCDLVRLLQVYRNWKSREYDKNKQLLSLMSSQVFNDYIEKRLTA